MNKTIAYYMGFDGITPALGCEGIGRVALYQIRALLDYTDYIIEVWACSFNVNTIRHELKEHIALYPDRLLFFIENIEPELDVIPFRRANDLVRAFNDESNAEVVIIPFIGLYHAINLNCRKVVICHDMIPQYLYELDSKYSEYKKEVDYIHKASMAYVSDKSARFICISENTKSHLIKYTGCDPDKISVLYTPLLRRKFGLSDCRYNQLETEMTSNEAIVKFNIELKYIKPLSYLEETYKLKSPYVFYPSKLRKYKNLEVIINACNYIKDDTRFHIAITDEYQDARRDENGKTYLCITRPIPEDDLYSVYYHATATISPSIIEGGFPMPAIEGMSVGTPAIMADRPFTNERIDAEGFDLDNCGIPFFKVDDHKTLGHIILEVYDYRERYVTAQKSFREKILGHTWSEYIDKMKELL